MVHIQAERGKYPPLFGGVGFHNNEAMLYPLIEKEHFDQLLCKCYREISPGFMRTFGGYDDWTKESMDAFAEYYTRMQKWTDTPIYFAAAKGKLHFEDEDIWEYAQNVAKNLAYLKKEKGVNHLRYYCVSNEMSQGTWGDFMYDLPAFKRYHEHLFRAFQKYGVDMGLLATDASEYEHWDTMDWAIENMDRITEDYCLHLYERVHTIYDPDFFDFFRGKCLEYVTKAIRNDNKRLILGEIGMQKLEDGMPTFGNDAQLGYARGITVDVNRWWDDDNDRRMYALGISDMIFAAINAGVFAVALWAYTDYPDPYSCAYAEKDEYARKWGMVEKFISGTTDAKYNKHGLFKWEDNGDHSIREFYWCLAPLMKLFKRNTKVLDFTTDNELLHCCGVLNRNGAVSIGIVNRTGEDTEIKLDSSLFGKNVRVYEYDAHNVSTNPFADIQDFCALLAPDAVTFTLKKDSVTFFTTDYEEKTESVYAKRVAVADGTLTWDEVDDPNHCYYRVYAAANPDFKPSKDNQIASTIATDLPIADENLFYKVLSVDIYGNV